MAISTLIESLQGMAWPEFLQPHVEVLLLWITWAVDYIDLDYLEYLLWLFLPIIVVFVLPIILVIFIYGCIIFVHVYGLRHQIQEAYHTSYWNGARVAIASFWDAVGVVWHGYELRGIENVPDDGPALFIYYHGCLPLDVYYLISKLVIHKNRTLHCVGDKFIFKLPGWKPLCKMFSITAGTVEECTQELQDGNLLCIAPGGVREALFSDPQIYDIQWGKRLGFARVVINSKTPVIPMFTENCRESFRTPEWGRSFFHWLYEKTKMPLCPIYGGFPVKMITHLGKPMTFDYENTSPEESLIDLHNLSAASEFIVPRSAFKPLFGDVAEESIMNSTLIDYIQLGPLSEICATITGDDEACYDGYYEFASFFTDILNEEEGDSDILRAIFSFV